MLRGLFPEQISKALPAFCRAGRPENISFVQSWEQKYRNFAPLPPAAQPTAGRLVEYSTSGRVLRGEKRLQLLLTSRWGLWMFTTNGSQSQGTRQEWKGHNKAIVTWQYFIQLKYQVRKVRGTGIFLWAFWKKQLKQTKDARSLPN